MSSFSRAVSLPKNESPLEPKFSPSLSDVKSLEAIPFLRRYLGPCSVTPRPALAVTVSVVIPVIIRSARPASLVSLTVSLLPTTKPCGSVVVNVVIPDGNVDAVETVISEPMFSKY